MHVAGQLTLLSQPLDRTLLEGRLIPVDIVEHLRLHDHEASVDDLAVLLLLLAKCQHISVLIQLQRALALRKSHRSQRHCLSPLPVMLQQSVKIHIRHPVTVAHHKGLVTYILTHTLDAPSSHRIKSRVDQRHLPRLGVVVQYLHGIVLQIKAYIAVVKIVVRKILLYHILHISQTYDEIIIPVVSIMLHDMPQYRLAAYLDHRLRPQIIAVADAASETSGQNNYLHRLILLARSMLSLILSAPTALVSVICLLLSVNISSLLNT